MIFLACVGAPATQQREAPGTCTDVEPMCPVPGALHAVVPCSSPFRIRRARPGRAVPVVSGRDQPQPPGARLYPSDMSDAEWAVIEPLLPVPGWRLGRGGSPGRYCRREIVNAIRYLTHNGPVWRAMPADLPHWRTVYHYVRTWQETGATRRMHDTLREQVRTRWPERGPQPTAAIIDSQSVKAANTVGKGSRGYDAGENRRQEEAPRCGRWA